MFSAMTRIPSFFARTAYVASEFAPSVPPSRKFAFSARIRNGSSAVGFGPTCEGAFPPSGCMMMSRFANAGSAEGIGASLIAIAASRLSVGSLSVRNFAMLALPSFRYARSAARRTARESSFAAVASGSSAALSRDAMPESAITPACWR